jgi:phosphopantothenoylcysteine decarboxylase/phosphopantothenate--cysteine ligase
MIAGKPAHPSKEILGSDGSELDGRRIVLCVTGSVAAYRAVDMARLLMRHGAEVHAVMSESTSQLLPAEMMKWATGNSVVTRLTGDLEHISLADYGKSDLILVYPCTANTIGKAANGIDDTPVTSVLSVGIGSKTPVIIAPAMHQAMYENPFIMRNVEKLKQKVIFVEPKMEEGKAKVAEPEQVLKVVLASISGGPLSGKRVLVTAGSTVEYIDPIRVVTNLSTGRMGLALAREARRMGAIVTLVYGHGTAEPGNSANKLIRVDTGAEMLEAVKSELTLHKMDIAIMCAAVADYTPRNKSAKKIDSRDGKIAIDLERTEKVVDHIKRISPDTTLVAFKADHNVSESTLIEKALKKLRECDADLVVANDVGKVAVASDPDKNEVYIVDAQRKVTHLALDSKSEIARKLLSQIVKLDSTVGKAKTRQVSRQSS